LRLAAKIISIISKLDRKKYLLISARLLYILHINKKTLLNCPVNFIFFNSFIFKNLFGLQEFLFLSMLSAIFGTATVIIINCKMIFPAAF